MDPGTVLAEVARSSGLQFRGERLTSALATVTSWLGTHASSASASGAAWETLLETLVVQESYFDRDLEQLQAIDRALEERAARHARVSIWSAGCAAGEETYSLAFLCAARGLLARVALVGTDLSRSSIERAKLGRYSAWAVRLGAGTPAMRHLTSDGPTYVVPDEIRSKVRFERLDLLTDDYPSEQHIITCRNVLIYLDAGAVARVARKLAGALADDGVLFVAPSDPRLDRDAPLVVEITERGVSYRKLVEPQRKGDGPLLQEERSHVRAQRKGDGPLPQEVRSHARVIAPSPPRGVLVPRPPSRPTPPTPTIKRPRTLEPTSTTEIRDLADRGESTRARALLVRAIAERPLDPELHFLAALLAERPIVALESIDRAIYLAPEMPLLHLFAGQLHGSLGDRARARRAYERALGLLVELPEDQLVPWSDETSKMLAAAARCSLAALR